VRNTWPPWPAAAPRRCGWRRPRSRAYRTCCCSVPSVRCCGGRPTGAATRLSSARSPTGWTCSRPERAGRRPRPAPAGFCHLEPAGFCHLEPAGFCHLEPAPCERCARRRSPSPSGPAGALASPAPSPARQLPWLALPTPSPARQVPSPDRIDVHLSRIQPAQMRIDPVARLAPQLESRGERYRWGTSACSVGHEAGRRSLIRCGAARGLMQSRAAHQSRRPRFLGWFRSCACLRGPGAPVNNRRTRIAMFPDRGRRGACRLTGAAGGANGARGTGGP
jgi:hypothetical protein